MTKNTRTDNDAAGAAATPSDEQERKRVQEYFERGKGRRPERPPKDEVTEASKESFPASDSPAWTKTHTGAR